MNVVDEERIENDEQLAIVRPQKTDGDEERKNEKTNQETRGIDLTSGFASPDCSNVYLYLILSKPSSSYLKKNRLLHFLLLLLTIVS
jgi:hypothetical protein